MVGTGQISGKTGLKLAAEEYCPVLEYHDGHGKAVPVGVAAPVVQPLPGLSRLGSRERPHQLRHQPRLLKFDGPVPSEEEILVDDAGSGTSSSAPALAALEHIFIRSLKGEDEGILQLLCHTPLEDKDTPCVSAPPLCVYDGSSASWCEAQVAAEWLEESYPAWAHRPGYIVHCISGYSNMRCSSWRMLSNEMKNEGFDVKYENDARICILVEGCEDGAVVSH
ncbi:unnamed protein product [Triticum turgidum subsp. durum]|uniref:Uncharacterized protein n=1 Tax=Triticum turgidum subsp. durum TaxID=4567 RepID=A0A9R1QHX7_TRITD|nr:unnamed protein product [Triticum turgidum subsp. durum]